MSNCALSLCTLWRSEDCLQASWTNLSAVRDAEAAFIRKVKLRSRQNNVSRPHLSPLQRRREARWIRDVRHDHVRPLDHRVRTARQRDGPVPTPNALHGNELPDITGRPGHCHRCFRRRLAPQRHRSSLTVGAGAREMSQEVAQEKVCGWF